MAGYKWLLAALLTVSGGASAADHISLILNGFSYHYPHNPGFNEKNAGYGLQYDAVVRPRHRLMAGGGVYMDSYFTTAKYLGLGYTYRTLETAWQRRRYHLDIGGVVMAVNSGGYKHYYGVDVLVAPLPFISVGTDTTAVNITYAPALGGAYASVFTLQLKLGIL